MAKWGSKSPNGLEMRVFGFSELATDYLWAVIGNHVTSFLLFLPAGLEYQLLETSSLGLPFSLRVSAEREAEVEGTSLLGMQAPVLSRTCWEGTPGGSQAT